MLCTSPGSRLALYGLIAVWLLHPSVSAVHAQAQDPDTPPVSASELQPSAAGPSSQPTTLWKPKHFPRLYPRPAQDEVELEEQDSDLMITGGTTFVLSYMFTVGFAAMVVGPAHQDDCDAGNTTVGCNDAAMMMIPIVGPLLTTGSGNKGLFAMLSLSQVASLVLTLVGISKYVNSDEAQRGWAANRALQVYAGPLQGGGFAATRVAF